MAHQDPVVTAEWLKERLDSGSASDILILDVTWYSAKDGQQDYLQKHIPGSQWFNIMQNVQNSELFPRNIPEASSFQDHARSLGVNADSHVVVYDRFEEQAGFFIGSRAWWLFKLFGHAKVSVLDGGLPNWETLGYPTTTEIPTSKKPGNFTATFRPELIRRYEEMAENLSHKRLQVCDTRAANKFSGDAKDPKTGHYPAAVNVTLASVLVDRNTKRLKTTDELKEVFTSRGVDLTKPVVGMCNSGMSSCSGALAAYRCGVSDVSVYLGGFTEWSRKAKDGEIEQST